jgi:hypothetical protein
MSCFFFSGFSLSFFFMKVGAGELRLCELLQQLQPVNSAMAASQPQWP